MSKEKTISLCMIVKDEEKYIRNCLESIKRLVDEIIIVDTGSSDKTIEIAKEYTKNIKEMKWNDDFSTARNFSIKNATSDYILILDADEVISESNNIKDMLIENIDCYVCKIKNHLGNGISNYHEAIRIFKNRKNIKFSNKLHEQVNVKQDYIVGKSSIEIEHFGYLGEVQKEKNKRKRNMQIIKKDVLINRNPYNVYNLAREYFFVESYVLAEKYFRESYNLNKSALYIPDLINKWAKCMFHNGKIDDAITLVENSLLRFPYETELFFTNAMLHLERGNYELSEVKLKKCIELGDQGYMVTEGIGSYIALVQLSKIEYKKGNRLKSFDLLVESLKLNKTYVPALIQFFEVVESERINSEEIIKSMEILFPIDNKENLQCLLDVLYHVRSPLLSHYLKLYQINTNENVVAVGKMFDKKYIDSYKKWMEIDSIDKENFYDVITLSYIISNSNLLDRLNFKELNEYEFDILKSIILKRMDLFNQIPEKIKCVLNDVRGYLLKMGHYNGDKTIGEMIEKY